MKLLIYGTFPANEADRITRHLRGDWDVSAVFDTEPVERKRALLAEADVMVTSVFRANDPPAPRLRLLQCSSAGTGTDGIALAHLPAGCVFCNVHGHEIAIAEYVICTILDWSIGYRRMTTFAGEWSMSDWKEFLSAADFVLVCAPLTPDTRHMIDASWFAAMKSSAVLIHVGRGPVIHEQSLYEALRDRRIRGASLDVWYNYPRGTTERVRAANFPFHTLPNVVATPHKSGHTEGTCERRFRAIAENLDAFAQGRPLADIVAIAGAAGP